MATHADEATSSASSSSRCHYEVLGVESGASYNDIRRAYKLAARRSHPDKHTTKDKDTKEKASAEFQRVQAAWSILGDEKRREEYDKELERQEEVSLSIAYEVSLSEMTCEEEEEEEEDDDEDRGDASRNSSEEGANPRPKLIIYTYPCRCGQLFEATKEDILEGCEIFSCMGCSLNLKIVAKR
mmetsp:Transcript_19769/g.32216  ORF Transcript_19769/g.32216 Transcript_19769/m.32216 type:complete len:184 (+) Transcript_19769:17-568(+)